MIVFTVAEENRIKDEYARRIYTHLYHQANKDPVIAAACRKPNKTLNGTLNYIRQRARGREYSGCAVIRQDEVYRWAAQYLTNDRLNYEGAEDEDKTGNDAGTEDKSVPVHSLIPTENRRLHRSSSKRTDTMQHEEAPEKSAKAVQKAEPDVPAIHTEAEQMQMIEEFYRNFGVTGL